MIERAHPQLCIRRQCELLGLAASSYYHRPEPVDAEDLELMRLLDEEYTRHPFYGVERMTWQLRQLGHRVNSKRVRRLLRLMGLMAVYPKPRLSKPGAVSAFYPYLLGGIEVGVPDQVWAADITYVRLAGGFCFLCAILDWSSRYVVSWAVSNTADALLCIEVLERALATGRVPSIFNTDQGAQFTCADFLDRLLARQIRPSWDGRGRWVDNVFVERLWRTVKYECVYLQDWNGLRAARRGLDEYFWFYNHERPHFALDKRTPAAAYQRYPINAARQESRQATV